MKKSVRIIIVTLMYAFCALFACGCDQTTAKNNAAFRNDGGATTAPVGTVFMQVKTPDGGYQGSITPERAQDQSSGEGQPSAYEEWTPEIIEYDEPYVYTPYDDSVRYEYTSETVNFKTVSGGFTQEKGNGEFNDFTVTGTNSLAVCGEETSFPYGTFSCDVKTVKGYDTGIVYGLSTYKSMFWESGVSYYIFLLSADGKVYLGKIDDGVWSVLKRVSYSFNTVDTFNLKVVYKNYKSYCYVNGTLLIECKERKPLTGTRFGIRGGGSGAVFSNISVTNDYLI